MLELISNLITKVLFFSLYFENPGSFPKPLSAKEEKEAFERLRESGDEEARNKLIEHNLRLVAHIIKKYYSAGGGDEDLISIGTIGLIKAVSSFSYEKGTRFATYASKCIENEILMFFRSTKKTSQDVFISDPIDTDGEGNTLTLGDIISEDFDMIDSLDSQMKAKRLRGYIKSALDEREQKIICLRYGLSGKAALTQLKTAKLLGISRSYVSRIEKRALEKLHRCFKKDGVV
ncbi:MAG: RNA polymerase sporulation sigma factor SigK [Oscillospiraceae bacterium]|nr:RNA polymerase sporulation sigma factor SigK [Oscillospiraceae bacterium]